MTLENSESTAVSEPGTVEALGPPTQTVEAAIDRMPRLGLSKWAVFGLVATFFFGLYETAIIAIALPSMTTGLGVTATQLALAISLNFVGFAIGSYVVGYFADRYGRQLGLRLTFLILGVGSLASAFAWNTSSLTVFRFVAGCGMGAVLSIITGYIGEMSPRAKRGGIIARISLVATILIALASLAGVPVVNAIPANAWRVLLAVGALSLLLLPLINRRDIVESPRWLVEHNGLARAEIIVRAMEKRARGTITAVSDRFVEPERLLSAGTKTPFKTLFSSRTLVGRLVMMIAVWFLFYIGFFGIATYQTLFLQSSGIPADAALNITALSRTASFIAAIVIIFLIDRFERKLIIAVGTGLIVVGVLLVVMGFGIVAATIGTFLMAFGTGAIAPPAYTYTAEIFPTKVRATGASIADGFGHLGGAAAPFIILPILVGFGPIAAGVAVIIVLCMATVIVSFGVKTKGRTLEEIAQ